ncbi:MAG: hypothetical protein QOE55_5869 [Acidobacteriaceae bacterium]|jgi:hypothetical protein|nr:hypothetical protein [Acidobacteriaceae bacterium]
MVSAAELRRVAAFSDLPDNQIDWFQSRLTTISSSCATAPASNTRLALWRRSDGLRWTKAQGHSSAPKRKAGLPSAWNVLFTVSLECFEEAQLCESVL